MATLGSDIYKIQEFNEELIKSNIDEDSSTLAIGIFGYLEDAFSHIMQNNIIVSSEYVNEMFPTRVKYEKSMMDYAMLYNIDDINATPSTMNVVLCLVESEVNKVLNTRTDNKFTIDRECAFYFGEYEFHLEYDIVLKRSILQNTTIMYNATYDNSIKNPISKITTPYLTTPYRQTINGTTYIFINCILRQVTYSEVYKKIITSNAITNKTLEFEFGDQLSSFSMTIKPGNGDAFNIVPLLDGSSNVGVEGLYCYYRFIDSNNIRILFDSDSYIPKLNDEITIFIQTTKGEEGNFEYVEDITTSISSETYGYDNLPVLIKSISDAKYGEDKINISELKKIIAREALARGSVTSTTDLFNYLNTMSDDKNKLTFIKRSDNQFERLYYSYLLVKNDYEKIVPTNTIDIKLLYYDSQNTSSKDFDSNTDNRYILRAGNHFNYIKNNTEEWFGQRVLPGSIDYFENSTDVISSNDFIYSNPFLMIINTKPLLYISYYLTIINKKYELLTDSNGINEDSDLQFIALSCDWNRAYKDNSYRLSFQCTQNINEDRGLIEKDEYGEVITDDQGNYTSYVRAILAIGDYSNNITDKTNNCFVEGTLTNYSETNGLYVYQFDFEIPTEDKINKNNELEIYNVYNSRSTPTEIIYLDNVMVRNRIFDADGVYNLIEGTSTNSYAEWKKTVGDTIYKISHTGSVSSIDKFGWEGTIYSTFEGTNIISIESPGRSISSNLERINVKNIMVDTSINLDKAIGEYLYSGTSGNVISWKRTITDRFEEDDEDKKYEFTVSYDGTKWKFEFLTSLDLSDSFISDIKINHNTFSQQLTVTDVYSKEIIDVADGAFKFYKDSDTKTIWTHEINPEVEYTLTHEKSDNAWSLKKLDSTPLTITKNDVKTDPTITVSNAINSTGNRIEEAEGIYYQTNSTTGYKEWRKGEDRVYIVRYLQSNDTYTLTGPGSPNGEMFSSFSAKENSDDSVSVVKVTNSKNDIIETAIGTYELYEKTDEEETWKFDDGYNKTYYLTKKDGNYSIKSFTNYYNYTIDQTTKVNVDSVENMKIYIFYKDESVTEDKPLTTQLKTTIVPDSYLKPLDGYVVSNVYNVNGDEGGEFFFNYTDIISSKITVTQESDAQDTNHFKQYLYLKSVPMVRSAYLDEDTSNSEELIDIIESKRGYIENALTVLEDQFGIDFKFYNTYGPSKTFFIDTEQLDRVDIKLNFEISLKPGADKSNIELIKNDIKEYIENLNNTEYDLHMSNIITKITNDYSTDTINYIEFININDKETTKQFLSRISIDELDINTPPEFINIHTIYEEDAGQMVSKGIGIDMDEV